MTRRQKREYILVCYGNEVDALGQPGCGFKWLLTRKRAALTALAQIDAGKRWRDVLKEFER